MLIKELKIFQKDNIPIQWEWKGLQMLGKIETFTYPDQVVIKWYSMGGNDIKTDFISIIPCNVFVLEENEINIKSDEE